MSEPSLPDKILTLHQALARAKMPHAFGGALALAYYAEPRATIDIDLNLFLAPTNYPEVQRTLATLGIGEGPDAASVLRDGQCRMWWSGTPIDIFFSYDAFHEAMSAATRKQSFGDTRIPVLAPEHLLVCKAVFDRPKDWLDIEQMLVCVDELDLPEVRAWLVRIVGANEPRLERLDALIDSSR